MPTELPLLRFPVGSAVATPDVCRRLAKPLRDLIDAERRNGVAFDDEFDAFVRAVEQGAHTHRTNEARQHALVADLVTDCAPHLSRGMDGEVTISATEYARRNGVSRQTVQERCDRGTLKAAKDENGRWRIAVDDQEGQ